jgi:hypothetical protein
MGSDFSFLIEFVRQIQADIDAVIVRSLSRMLGTLKTTVNILLLFRCGQLADHFPATRREKLK